MARAYSAAGALTYFRHFEQEIRWLCHGPRRTHEYYETPRKRSKHERDWSWAQTSIQLDNGDDHDDGCDCEGFGARAGA
jgi:hypothetical protein